jgi:IS5 family transposase
VDVDWLIAERPGKVKTLKQHPHKNKTAINIECMKASIRNLGGAPVSHHQAAVQLRESQIQGAAEER